MSTTHPTEVTTEWDELQRKFGNLPKLAKRETSEQLSDKLVAVVETELLREARLRQWRRRLSTFGTPIELTFDNFVEQVTKYSAGNPKEQPTTNYSPSNPKEQPTTNYSASNPKEQPSSYSKNRPEYNEREDDQPASQPAGRYVAVLLVDRKGREGTLLARAWSLLAKAHVTMKFTIGSTSEILKASAAQKPSTVLLYFGGACVLQRNAIEALTFSSYEIGGESLEERVVRNLREMLNSCQDHTPLAESEPDSSESEDDLKEAGRAFRRGFMEGQEDRNYTSWVLDRALGA